MIPLLAGASLFLLGTIDCASLRICAFDVQLFGLWKAQSPATMETIQAIIGRCDLCVVQQIRNPEVADALLEQLNEDGDNYDVTMGDPAGKTGSKEQIGIFYKKASLSVVETAQPKQDAFNLDPLVALFKIIAPAETKIRRRQNARGPSKTIKEFFVIGARTDPTNTAREIEALASVYDKFNEKFQIDDAVILGNFHAACNFLSKEDQQKLSFFTDESFKSLISDDTDTTVTDTNCAYDRIIVAGRAMKLKAMNGGIFKFDDEYVLQPREAKHVSDHYPVEFSLNWDDSAANPRAIPTRK